MFQRAVGSALCCCCAAHGLAFCFLVPLGTQDCAHARSSRSSRARRAFLPSRTRSTSLPHEPPPPHTHTPNHLKTGSEQHAWISAELASVDRRATPWLVVSGHRPLYVASTNNWAPDGDQPAGAEARRALEGLLMEHRVDVTLHGHHHSYQVISCVCLSGWACAVFTVWRRFCMGALWLLTAGAALLLLRTPFLKHTHFTPPELTQHNKQQTKHDNHMIHLPPFVGEQRTCPAYEGRCVRGPDADGASAAAPVHVVLGNAGASLSLNVPAAPEPIWEVVKLWWGYVRFEASAARLRAEAVSDLDGRVMDAFELRKPEGWGAAFEARRARARTQQGAAAAQAQAAADATAAAAAAAAAGAAAALAS